MKQRIFITAVIGLLLIVTMAGVRHIDGLNDGIKLKQIEIQDNSLRLELLDKKYLDLNKQLEAKDADKQKVEQQLKELEKERLELQKALQAKKDQKERDIAARAAEAAKQAVSTPKAYAASGSCAEWMAAAGIPITTATTKLILKESSCNPRAVNPTSGACGIPQAYPCSKLPNGVNTEPVAQLRWMDGYVKNRYGTWENALATWYSRCGSRQGCWY